MLSRNLLAIILQLAASGADAYYTDRNQHMRFHYENNPISAQFVGRREIAIPYFSVTTGVKIIAPIYLRRRHHGKLASIVGVAGIADSTYGAATSATH